MDQMAIGNCSIASVKESLPEFGIDDRPAVFLPPLILVAPEKVLPAKSKAELD